jgi:hypothetical protein
VFTKVALLLNPSSDIILTASKPLWNVKSSCRKRLLALTDVLLPHLNQYGGQLLKKKYCTHSVTDKR